MKKAAALLLCLALILSFTGCGGAAGKTGAEASLNKTVFESYDTLKITVKSKGLKYENGPWVGIVPAGNYKTEYELDDVDFWYSYISEDEQAFEFYFDDPGMESGEWMVCVTDGDDNGEGGVLCTVKFTYTNTIPEEEDTDDTEEPDEEDMDRDYFAERYCTNICPFTIISNGNEVKYYFRNGGFLLDWVYTEENVDGWYYYNDYVISKDGKYAVGPETNGDSFSSFCDYTAEKYDGPTLSEEEQAEIRDGIFYVINSYTPIVTNWGMTLKAENSEEDPDRSCREIGSKFIAGEPIAMNIDLDLDEDQWSGARGYILPHQDPEAYHQVKMTEELLEKSLLELEVPSTPYEEGPKDVFTITEDMLENAPDGRFDLVFTFDEFITAFVVFTVTK